MRKSEFIKRWKDLAVFNQQFCKKDIDYSIADSYIKGIDSLKFNSKGYVYIVDLYSLNFFYYYDHPYFIGTKDNEHINRNGYLYFIDRAYHKDYEMILNAMHFIHMTHFNKPDKNKVISFDVNIVINKEDIVLMTLKTKILELDKSGKIWLVLVSSERSTNKKSGNLTVIDNATNKTTYYDVKTLTKIDSKNKTLTKRELEVLKLIATGLKESEIAKKLFISINTVKYHKKNLFSKYNIRNSAELIRFAINNKIIE
ncbi:MAG: response regulator transcription factor [Bacteroidales bacterium]|jgi:DNA-binding CsgD family transcriptional regulator|nr:response regulator transcription factor [Bacteroidales bacterium]